MTITREATCHCGDFRITLEGDPLLVSQCCCTRCQRRTGSLFGVTAYFRPAQLIARTGASAQFQPDRPGAAVFHFCPRCGSNLLWIPPDEPEIMGVAGGAFADPTLPGPHRMTFRAFGHPSIRAQDGIPVHDDAPPG